MCDEARDAVEEAELAGRRSGRSARAATATSRSDARALAARVHRLGLQRRVAVLLREYASSDSADACSRSPARRATRPVGDARARARVVAPARAAPIEQPHVPVRDSLRRARASGRESDCGAPSRTRGAARRARAPRAIAAASSGVTRSSASRHSTQSCRGLRPRRNSSAAPNPSHALLDDARAAARARFLRYHRCCPNRRRRCRRRTRADARHSASLAGGVARDDTELQGKRFGHARQRRCGVWSARRGCMNCAHSTWFPIRRRLARAPHGARSRGDERVLVVRPSSLGDIVHALAIVADIREHRPGAADRLGRRGSIRCRSSRSIRGVRRVIPVALRRWRHRPLAAATWREIGGVPARAARATSTTPCSTCRSRSRAR